MQAHQPDLERPYVDQGKYEVAIESLHCRFNSDVWQEFTDELEVEKAIYQFDPEYLLRDIIHIVATGRHDKADKLATYERIYDKVSDFVEHVTERRVTSHMEAL